MEQNGISKIFSDFRIRGNAKINLSQQKIISNKGHRGNQNQQKSIFKKSIRLNFKNLPDWFTPKKTYEKSSTQQTYQTSKNTEFIPSINSSIQNLQKNRISTIDSLDQAKKNFGFDSFLQRTPRKNMQHQYRSKNRLGTERGDSDLALEFQIYKQFHQLKYPNFGFGLNRQNSKNSNQIKVDEIQRHKLNKSKSYSLKQIPNRKIGNYLPIISENMVAEDSKRTNNIAKPGGIVSFRSVTLPPEKNKNSPPLLTHENQRSLAPKYLRKNQQISRLIENKYPQKIGSPIEFQSFLVSRRKK